MFPPRLTSSSRSLVPLRCRCCSNSGSAHTHCLRPSAMSSLPARILHLLRLTSSSSSVFAGLSNYSFVRFPVASAFTMSLSIPCQPFSCNSQCVLALNVPLVRGVHSLRHRSILLFVFPSVSQECFVHHHHFALEALTQRSRSTCLGSVVRYPTLS